MRKAEYKVTIVCPFDYCRMDIDITKMTSMCVFSCEFAEHKREQITETIKLDKNSEEIKEFKEKYFLNIIRNKLCLIKIKDFG